MRTWWRRGGAAAVLLTLLATACGGGGEAGEGESGEPVAAEGGPSFIYITPTPIGVNKFLELGQIGTQRVAEELGGTWETYESNDSSTRRSNLEAAIDEAPDVIVLTTFDFLELADEFSRDHPDQEFILIDTCPEEPAENLHCGVFREYEASYLLGLMAGELSETKKVGSVVAVDIPFLHRYSDSFALGAQEVDPSITDSQLFIGGDNPFLDPARAKEQALALAAQGADHIFAVGSGSNGGVFEAAEEQGFFTYGVDVNECSNAPGHVVDNALKRVDNVVEQLLHAVLDGEAESVLSFGLAEDGTGVVALQDDVADTDCVIKDHPDIIEKVAEAAQGIIDGTITIPDPVSA